MTELGLPQQPLQRALGRQNAAAFADSVQALRDETKAALASTLKPVARNGGYYHDYFCPDHAAELVFDEHTPNAHACPIDNRVWSGLPFDDAWLWTANRRLAQRALRLALLWRVDGDPVHLAKAREILVGYAHIYPDVHSERDAPSVGKITHHALDESVWVIPITWACHWVWPDLEPADQNLLRQDLLEAAAIHIESQRVPRIHNYENWLNAALATIGTALGNNELVRRVTEDTFGVTDQLARGVLDDGHWYEGASSYHYFTLGAALALAMAREGQNDDLRGNPILRKMFEAPLRIAFPDDYIPAINDCWYHSRVTDEVGHGIPTGPAFYEIASGWYPSPDFEAVLTRSYRTSVRSSVEALLYGPDTVSEAPSPERTESNENASGFAVLRPQLPLECEGQLLLKYGPHGGGHGHADKLALSIYGGGDRWGTDLGTPGYGIAINDSWYRHTLSHSSIVIEGEAQPPATGEALRFRPVSNSPFGIADAQVVWEQGPYAAVYARRVVLARDGYFVVLTRIESPVQRKVHVVFHHAGTFSHWPDGSSSAADLPTNDAYAHLQEASAWPSGSGATVQIEAPVGGETKTELVIATSPLPGSHLITARSPGNPASDLRSTTIIENTSQAFWTAATFVYGDATQTTIEWEGRVQAGTVPNLSVRRGQHEESWSFTNTTQADFIYPLDS